MTFRVLDFRHIYNFMPTDRRGRRSLQIIISFVLLRVAYGAIYTAFIFLAKTTARSEPRFWRVILLFIKQIEI